ncbi:hypothetical protein BZY99_10485 [Pectobacterium versatile]|nr:hypothetical protein BZY99_10485 [Pectobacterium versatile]
MRWPPLLTPVTYLCKLLGIHAVAAFMQLELFRIDIDCMLCRWLAAGIFIYRTFDRTRVPDSLLSSRRVFA